MRTSSQQILDYSCLFYEHEKVKIQTRTESIHFVICLITCLLELGCAQGQKVPSLWSQIYFHNYFLFLLLMSHGCQNTNLLIPLVFRGEGRLLPQCSWLNLSVWKLTFGCLGICWLTPACSPTLLEAIISACFYIIIDLQSHRVSCLKRSYDLKYF